MQIERAWQLLYRSKLRVRSTGEGRDTCIAPSYNKVNEERENSPRLSEVGLEGGWERNPRMTHLGIRRIVDVWKWRDGEESPPSGREWELIMRPYEFAKYYTYHTRPIEKKDIQVYELLYTEMRRSTRCLQAVGRMVSDNIRASACMQLRMRRVDEGREGDS